MTFPASMAVPLLLLFWAVLFVFGIPVVALLRTRRTSLFALALAPIMGFAAISVVAHALSLFDFGTDAIAVPAVLAATGATALVLRRGVDRSAVRFAAGALPPVLLASALGLYPVFRSGFLTSLGSEIDSVTYLVRAEALQHHGILRPVPAGPNDFAANLNNAVLEHGFRSGDSYALAFLSSLSGLRPHLLFSVAMAGWHGLLAASVFAFAAYFFPRPSIVPLAAGVLAACHPLLHWPTVDSFLSQAAAQAAIPLMLLTVHEALRSRTWRAVVLAGLTVQLVAALYPVYLLPLAGVGAAWLLAAALGGVTSRRGGVHAAFGRLMRIAMAGAGVVGAAYLLAPAAWKLLIVSMTLTWRGMGAAGSEGNIHVFPNASEIFGVLNHLQAAIPGYFHFHQPPEEIQTVTAVLLASVCLVALLTTRGDRRVTLAGVVLSLLAALYQQRFVALGGVGFPYGYFKIACLAAVLAPALVAAGIWRLPFELFSWWKDVSPRLRAAVFLGALAPLVSTSTFHLVTTAQAVADHPVADRPLLELSSLRSRLDHGLPIVLDDPSWPRRSWVIYMLTGIPLTERSRFFAHALPLVQEGIASPRRVLVCRGTQQSVAPAAGRTVWENARYSLVELPPGLSADVPLSRGRTDGVPASDVSISWNEHGIRISDPAGGGVVRQTVDAPITALRLVLASDPAGALRVSESGRPASSFVVGPTHMPLDFPVRSPSGQITLGAPSSLTLYEVDALSATATVP